MSMADVRYWRNLPFLKRGMRVEVDGQPGRITSTYGHNLRIRFDGWEFPMNSHPRWEIVYFTADGSVLADFRGHTMPRNGVSS